MKKILFYYNHQEDIGHIVCLINIIKAIKHYYKDQSQIFIFHGGKKQPFTKFPKEIKIFHLPYPFYSRVNLKMPVQLNPCHIKARINFMLSKLKAIKPDIFITEFFPFGRPECKYELFPILKWLRQKKIKIYSSLPLPYFVHSKEKVKELLLLSKFYDKIFIHARPKVDLKYISNNIYLEKRISKNHFLAVFNHLKYKIYFTGYIMPFKVKKNKNIVNNRFILIYRGGGTTSLNLITNSILASKLLGNKYKFLIVAGPATTRVEMGFLKNLIKQIKARNILLKKYLPYFFTYLKNCKICVGTAGFSAYELLYLRKEAIVVPFVGYLNRERADQIARAQMLKDCIGASILNYNTLTPEILTREIMKRLSSCRLSQNKKIDNAWFDGARKTADMIMQNP